MVALPFLAALAAAPAAFASNDEDDWSLGPIGGTFRVQPGTAFLRVQSMPSGTPGYAAGLLPGDMIYGAIADSFGTTLTNATAGGYKGAVQDLACAIDFAEDWDGLLPLRVLRPGASGLTAKVQLSPIGAFGAAYPRGCPKYNTMYEEAVAGIHALISPVANPNFSNNNGRFGLILLSHPDWDSTSAPRPYRTSINKLRDRAVIVLNAAALQPVESGQPGHLDPGCENWELTTQVMFLAEYVNRTEDRATTVMDALQRGVRCLENRIQSGGTAGNGHMGHGGVVGDYGNWALNIINVYTHAAFAMAKRAGVQPDQSKWDMSWNYLKLSTARSNGHNEDGYVDYGAPAWGQGNGYDSAGRTAGAVFAFLNYGQTPTKDDTDALNRMKGYLVRNYHRMQHTHAYTAGGVLFNQLALPYLPDRDQRYFMENTRYFYQFHRTAGSALQYFGGRMNNGGDSSSGYLNYDRVKLYNVAIAGAVANRGLPSIPAENVERIFLRFRAPILKWPKPEARAGVVLGNSTTFVTQITDSNGNSLTPGDYTAAWRHVGGPGTVTFSNPSSADTTVTFTSGGRHRLQVTVNRGSYSVVEPVDLDVLIITPPTGMITGQANYQVFTDIIGATVASLTSNTKYPNTPDITRILTSLEGTHAGENYGARIRGFIIPPATGEYRFFIASDDASQFRLGASEAAASTICSVAGYSGQYNWTANASQTSAIQNLIAGTPYFYEVLHKESGGADHLAVAWTGPGWTTPEVIAGRYLAVQSFGAPQITGHPAAKTIAAGGSVTFNVHVTGAGPFLFQWRKNGVALWPASPNPQVVLSNLGAGAAGRYDVTVTSPEGTVTSQSATLTVTGVGTPVEAALWRDVYSGIPGTSISNLTSAQYFPNFPSSGGSIASAEAPVDAADNYGQRWTGWLTPNTSGDHRFFIASDDTSELWLSTNDQPANRVRIAQVNGYTAARAWSSGGQSSLIPFVAGNRYYIEVRHKEAGSADHCAVAWQQPGESQPANGSAPIPGQYLSTLQGGIFEGMAANLTIESPKSSSINIPAGVGVIVAASVFPTHDGAIITWEKTSGPGNAKFTHPTSLATGVTFDTPGSYELRLTYDNGVMPSQLGITVHVGTATSTWNPSLYHYGDGSGSVSDNGSTISLIGSSPQGIGGNQSGDGFSLYGQTSAGDFDWTARIVSATNISSTNDERVGLAVRQGDGTVGNEVSAFVGTDPTPTEWMYWIRRASTGGTNNSTTVSQNATLPRWVRLTRVNGVVTGYFSTNGTTWSQSSTSTVTINGPARAGLVWSTNSTASGTATFDEVRLVGAVANIGPLVNVGTSQSVMLDTAARLSGSATDDGQPQPLSFVWSSVSGPGTVAFADATSSTTTATFRAIGTYVLRLGVSDGEVTTYSETTVTVTPAPSRWINHNGGSWSIATNWSNAEIISGIDTLADFSKLSLPSAPTVTLDGARTVGTLRTADLSNNNGWFISTGNSGPLTLATTSGSPVVDVINQSLTLRAVLSGTQGLIKSGSGLLRVETGGTWTGGTIVEAGMLEVLAKSGDVPYVIRPGAILRLAYSTGSGYASTNLKIHGTGLDATTGLQLRGGTSYNASGQIQLLDAPTTIRQYGDGLAAIGTFDINGNGLSVSAEASGSQLDANIQLISRGYGMSVTIASGTNTSSGDLVVHGPLNVGNLGFYKRGGGSVRLNAPATASNTAINLQGGSIITGVSNALGKSSILRVSSATTVRLEGSTQTVRELWVNGVRKTARTYTASNATFINGTGTLVVTEGNTPYQEWLLSAGLTPGQPGTALWESLDGSGVTNLVQFALGGRARDPAHNGWMFVFGAADDLTGQPMLITIAVLQGAVFAGSPTPTATIDGITYVIQGSRDLHHWTTPVEEVVPANSGGGAVAVPAGYEAHSFRLSPSTPSTAVGYLRVAVSSAP